MGWRGLARKLLVVLLQQVLSHFSWSLAASKGSEVSGNDIHAPMSICGRLVDKERAFRSTTSGNCTEHSVTHLIHHAE